MRISSEISNAGAPYFSCIVVASFGFFREHFEKPCVSYEEKGVILCFGGVFRGFMAIFQRPNRFYVAALVLFAGILAGCAHPASGPVGETHRPRLEAVWAQPAFAYGHRWKIYIRASDPDGDLDKAWFSFSGYAAVATVRFLEGKTKRANGYVETQVDLIGGHPKISNKTGDLSIVVEDQAGNVSPSKSLDFNVYEGGETERTNPPEGFAVSIKLGEFDFPPDVIIEEVNGDAEEEVSARE